MAIQKLQPSFKINEVQLKQLRQIAPEAFRDNILDFNTLYEALAESIEDDEIENEHFGLSWPGKRKAKKLATLPAKFSLDYLEGQGINEKTSKNFLIEGDNLEVLKLLQKSYSEKIKIIYFDPPYNTGTDLIYEDDFSETAEEYLNRSGAVDEHGRILSTNVKADGRFHSKWLNMMYPRIKLARNLLKDDGIMCVSIDDNELHNLRTIMNEIFGDENFIGVLKRRASRKTAHLSGTMSDMCDYVVIYCKSELSAPLSIEKVKDSTRPVFNKGNSITTRIIRSGTEARCGDGIYKKGNYKVKSLEFRLLDDLIIKDGKSVNEVVVSGPWRINQQVLDKTIYYTRNFGLRRYLLPEEQDSAKAMNDLLDDPTLYNEVGSEMLEKLFGFAGAFDNPKPTSLIKLLINACEGADINDDFILLDFFAGSGTSGHAIFDLEENFENKKFILVQLDERIKPEKAAFQNGYKSISHLTRERLIRAAKSYKPVEGKDLGFMYYRLSNSNFKKWQNYNGSSTEEVVDLFSQHENSLVDDWTPEKLLIEILLIEGFPLDSTIEVAKPFENNLVHRVSSDYCEHALFICLDNKVDDETIQTLDLRDNDIFICLDNAVTDQAKARLDDKGLIKTI